MAAATALATMACISLFWAAVKAVSLGESIMERVYCTVQLWPIRKPVSILQVGVPEMGFVGTMKPKLSLDDGSSALAGARPLNTRK